MSVAVAICLIGFAANWLVENQRAQATKIAKQQTETELRFAIASINKAMLSIDVALAAAEQQLGASLSPGENGSVQADVVLARVLLTNVGIRDIVMLEEVGTAPLASARESTRRLGIAVPPEFRRRLFEKTNQNTVMSEPLRHYATAEEVVLCGKLMALPGRKVALIAVIPRSTITSLITVSDTNEFILESAGGTPIFGSSPKPETSERGGVSADGIARVYSSVGVTNDSLYAALPTVYEDVRLVVDVPMKSVLSGANEATKVIESAAGVIMVVMVLVGYMLQVAVRRYEVVHEHVVGELANAMTVLSAVEAVILLVGEGGKILLWNRHLKKFFPSTVVSLRAGASFEQWVNLAMEGVVEDRQKSTASKFQVGTTGRRRKAHGLWRLRTGQVLSYSNEVLGRGMSLFVMRDVTKDLTHKARLRAALKSVVSGHADIVASVKKQLEEPVNAIAGIASLISTGHSVERRDREILASSLVAVLGVTKSLGGLERSDADRSASDFAPF